MCRGDSERQPGPARGQSPVGNGCSAGVPKPLQGLEGACLRVSRVSARIWAQEFCGILRGQRAICEGGEHRVFDEAKIKKGILTL